MAKNVQDAYSEILRLRNLFYQKWIESAETDEPSGYIRIVLSAKYEAFNKALELLSPSIVDPQPKDSGELTHSVTKISDQEEPVSDDLEIAACQSFNSACEDLNKEDKDSATYLKEYFKELWMCAFKDGAHWKEQQIMKEAINGEVFDNYDKDICQHHLELLVDIPKKYKDGDKVKLIIIKEDCV